MNKLGWIDMSTAEYITPAAALALASEFHRVQKPTSKGSLAIDIHRWDPEVVENLDQLGLFAILKIYRPKRGVTEGRNILLPMRSDSSVLSQQADDLNTEISEIVSAIDFSDELRQEVYDVLVEAMDNVASHAYPDGAVFEYTPAKRWWITAAVNSADRKLTVVIYDQGVSIPVSLPTWQNYHFVDNLLQRFVRRFFGTGYDVSDKSKDGLAIATAMKVAVTSTGLSYHGKGLPRMKAFIDKCPGGSLRIISRAGEYLYQKVDKVRRHSHLQHPVDLGGTLVEWEVSY